MDHFSQIGGRDRSIGLGPAEDEMLEGYSTLSHLATVARTARRADIVCGGCMYRHPGVLIKTVKTLDVLAEGEPIWALGQPGMSARPKG